MLKDGEILRCPKCGGSRFLASAYVVQEWIIDENGSYVQVYDDCAEIARKPSLEDYIQCYKCGYEDTGYDFRHRG